MEYCTATKKNKLPIHATAWIASKSKQCMNQAYKVQNQAELTYMKEVFTAVIFREQL